ncbi:MAG TPA: bifunctional phosphoserine phosphatase/homoserine phosphotransferase ThrH [Opitutaceae bacterium]|nr:bifunctional phosphoserine phosphatase/homoserine phosphotransferase ThrH [Opitutaceae bacterium]
MKQSLVTLDLEGVLVPEIWVAVAERTGIAELRRTTRDEPDYDKLMRYRLDILGRHRLGLAKIQEVIGSLQPLPGALEFLRALRAELQVVILSDTFEQFAAPLLRQLEWPTLLCHRLVVENDRITGYRLRVADGKRRAVAMFQGLSYQVIAAGDSFNDLGMLQQADHAFLFRATDAFAKQYAAFPALTEYADLLRGIRGRL